MASSRKSQQNSAASVLDGYEPLEVIGSGTFGLIRKVKRISDGKIFARKELQFDRMTDRDRKQIVAEVNILRGLQNENIVKYEERFIDRENQILYIVMEYCEGGDLGSTIKKCRKTNTLLPEEMVWSYVSQMVLGLDACHYRGTTPPTTGGTQSPTEEITVPSTAILHRDLKPENVFLDGNQNIKIGDFGLSKEVAAQSFACTYVGTPYYMSPELATGSPYDIKADIWALGCVAFELCALAPPFDAQNQAELTRKIKLGHVPELPRGYSSELGNLIRTMLDLNPKRRPTTRSLLRQHSIRLACRTIELAALSRKIGIEKNRLRAEYYELEMREHALNTREQELAVREASSSKAREQDQREQELDQREKCLLAREEALQEREDHLTHIEAIDDRERGLRTEEVSRERSSSQYAASSALRRPMNRRISSGTVTRVRASPAISNGGMGGGGCSSDAVIEVVHVRPNGFSPRTHKTEAVRQRYSKATGGLPPLGSVIRTTARASRHRTCSSGSEEWVDNEGDGDTEVRSLVASQRGGAETPSSRRRSSAATTSTQAESNEEEVKKYTPRDRTSRKSITALPPAARAWNEMVNGSFHYGEEEDVSMRDASAIFGGGEDKENVRHVREGSGFDKGQSMPAQDFSDQEQPFSRPALTARNTIATTEVLIDPKELAPPPVYDLSNDEDLPSPFLRKVTRHNNDVLSKRVLKCGSGLVNPSNFLVRAAAAGAARQGIAAAAKEQAENPNAALAVPLLQSRRMSAVSAAPTGRVAMPTSASAKDVRSSESLAAPVTTKRRSSAVASTTTATQSSKSSTSSVISARKSLIPTANPIVRQRAA